jgi:outer membrane protein with beta-barrel domain
MKKLNACLAALAIISFAGTARAGGIGIGAFGGVSVPVIQDDTDRGSLYGVRVPVSLVPMLTVEPYFASTKGGDVTQDLFGASYTRSGIDVTSYGANLLLTFGGPVQFYPYAGIGSFKLERDGLDVSQTGYNFGLGLGFGLPATGLSLHLRGELAAAVDGDVSRKWANVTAGLHYNFLKLPTP